MPAGKTIERFLYSSYLFGVVSVIK